MATEIEDDIIEPRQTGVLGKIFGSCSGDPRGSVHRAWGVSLLFIVLYFILAIIESEFSCFGVVGIKNRKPENPP
jgi:hypothetical protein